MLPIITLIKVYTCSAIKVICFPTHRTVLRYREELRVFLRWGQCSQPHSTFS